MSPLRVWLGEAATARAATIAKPRRLFAKTRLRLDLWRLWRRYKVPQKPK